MTRGSHGSLEWNELVGRLLSEDLDAAGHEALCELLRSDDEARTWFVRCLDLEVAVRAQAKSLDDEDFALLEVQAALDAQPASVVSPLTRQNESADGRLRGRFTWAVTATIAVVGIALGWAAWTAADREPVAPVATANSPPDASLPTAVTPTDMTSDLGPALLSGAVGARWAGEKLEMPEGQRFAQGQRLELVEGLAELDFRSGARVVMQGPAILVIRDKNTAQLSVGRISATVPKSAGRFTIQTSVAELASRETEFGAEIDVDGSLITQVYVGDVELQLKQGDTPAGNLVLGSGQGLEIDAASGRVRPLDEPYELHFVRYLPQHQMLLNLADVVAGRDGLSDGTRHPYHRGISLLDGSPVDDYGAPIVSTGQYHLVPEFPFVDGVFIPDGSGAPVQVDSIGRTFSEFPATAGDCWGGAIMARRPKDEESLPLIRLEYHGDNYGYVNWLHIASKPEELSPQGQGLIGMHANCGITFDLHAIRARHPNKKVVRFRALVGNLESKPEPEPFAADAWVLLDGQLRYSRQDFSREDGPAAIDLPLADRDRFLVLVVTDAGAKTAYDWVAFGDPMIEMTNLEPIPDAAFLPPGPRRIAGALAAVSSHDVRPYRFRFTNESQD